MIQKRLDANFFDAKVRANAFSVQTSMNIVCVLRNLFLYVITIGSKGANVF